jgi:hypothetical protein
MAVLGPDIQPEGELRTKGQVYQKQLAATIASLMGDPVAPGHPPGRAIGFPVSAAGLQARAQVKPLPPVVKAANKTEFPAANVVASGEMR